MLSNSSLKILAIIFMLIDHIAATNVLNLSINSYPYIIMRSIGRLAFPIFAFLIVEGYFYTRNIKLYLTRLLIFAFISEIPFNLAFYNSLFYIKHQNVFFTLFLGLLSIKLYEEYKEDNIQQANFSVILIGLISVILHTDYNIFGILMIFAYYYFRGDYKHLFTSILIINLLIIIEPIIEVLKNPLSFTLVDFIQIFAILALILIKQYNHKKGLSLKYIFYVFYPLHLLVLYLI
ncbi:MAG TPA: TraX family protein [Haloplasmataceae bacterium]